MNGSYKFSSFYPDINQLENKKLQKFEIRLFFRKKLWKDTNN